MSSKGEPRLGVQRELVVQSSQVPVFIEKLSVVRLRRVVTRVLSARPPAKGKVNARR